MSYRATLREKRCKICDEFLPVRRVQSYPSAVLCGAEKCKKEHARRCRNRVKKKWRNSRAARDPAWHARQKALSIAGYQRRKTEKQAQTNGPAMMMQSWCSGSKTGKPWHGV